MGKEQIFLIQQIKQMFLNQEDLLDKGEDGESDEDSHINFNDLEKDNVFAPLKANQKNQNKEPKKQKNPIFLDQDEEKEEIVVFDDLDDELYEEGNQSKQPVATIRDQQLNQQKQILLDKQKMHYQQNQMFKTTHQKASDSGEIDILKILEQDKQRQQYEPAQFQYTISGDLPLLQKLNEKKTIQTRISEPEPQKQLQQPNIIMKMQTEQKQNIENSQKQSKQSFEKEESGEDEEPEKDDAKIQEQLEQRKEQKQQNEKVADMTDEQIQQSSSQKPQQEELKEEKKEQPPPKKIPYPKPLDKIDIIDMRQFLTSCAPKGGMIQCTIKRDKSGMGRLYPRYHIHLTNGYRYLMSAKKQALNNTSNYLVTMNRDLNKGPNNLGKVRSNFMGTEFVFYDNGLNPSQAKSSDQARGELGVGYYESNLLGSKGPRKMKIALPRLDENDQLIQFRPIQDKQGIMKAIGSNDFSKINVYVNRQPKWNDVVQAYVLNFYGRVDKPSVKNFQLILEGKEENIYLQFGRIGKDVFNLDFQYPISPLQAFQISLSSFDYKIACE